MFTFHAPQGLASGLVNVQGTTALQSAGVVFNDYVTLAAKAVSYNDTSVSPPNQVFVVDQGSAGGTYSMDNFLNQDAQGYQNGKTLVIFKGRGDVTLSLTRSGRQFGPAVIAPLAKVIFPGDIGFVDGFVVADSFVATGSVTTPQMHGMPYVGELKCVV